ncbi:MAG: 2-amino-4-hydroxy-6-hydroxymethyldihydropteridine diphosphokinase [Deltaproteobacteria bacterium]|nr:2-amino-4-hydroxy-6-hydroxymethyldihydropteridine diphosphokinase [Deltaproteobacteria bacterium]
MTVDLAERVFIGLGGNLGDRRATLESALRWMADHPCIDVVQSTPLVETEPWGVADQPRFLNAVAEIRTNLEPGPLLVALQSAERLLGRTPNGLRWGPRTIDLDILLFGTRIIETDALVVPHPCLVGRAFVLEALLSLDSELIHPVSGMPLATYLKDPLTR